MSFFRAGPSLSHLLRHHPLHSAIFPRSTVSPLARVMLDDVCQPRCSAPLYTLYHVRSNDRDASHQSSSGSAQHKDGSSGQQHQQQQQQGSTELQEHHRDRQLESRRHWKRQRHLQHQHPLSLLQDAFLSPFSSSLPSLLGRSPFGPFSRSAASALPEMSIDMFTTEGSYNIHAAVPGLDKRDIRITVDDGVLRIEAERREERKERKPSTSTASSSSSSLPVNGSQQSATTGSQQTATSQPTDSSSSSASASSSSTSSAPSTTTAADSSNAVKADADSADDAVEYSYQESYYGRVERSLALPEDADADKLTARYENGVIKIEIPRVAEQKKEARRIEIQ